MNIEQFDLTEPVYKKIDSWHKDETRFLGKLGVRMVGSFSVSCASAVDAFVHSCIFVGKCMAAPASELFHFSASYLKLDSSFPINVSAASLRFHLLKTVSSLFNIILMPLVLLIDPNFLNFLSQIRKDKKELTEELESLRKELKQVKEALQQKKELTEELESLRKELKQVKEALQRKKEEARSEQHDSAQRAEQQLRLLEDLQLELNNVYGQLETLKATDRTRSSPQ